MLDCRAQDAEIKDHAIWYAGKVRTLVATANSGHHFQTFQNPTNWNFEDELEKLARLEGVPMPAIKTTMAGKIARMTEAGWWTRSLRKTTLKRNEKIEREAGKVTKIKQVYVSDHAAKIKAERAKANQQTLEGLEVCNDEGEAFNLQEIADKSVSNPKLRRAELMTRARGFEEAAEFMGHKALFLTLTCPSRFHRMSKYGVDVKKWRDASPKDGQNYLCLIWARIRAAWAKKNIVVYGFRVAEPHQDGTPHWHLLLFVPAEQVSAMLTIAHEHAHAENKGEAGSVKHRFTVKRIDATRGSATGYIAKYICKNIDGTKENGEALEHSEKESEHGTSTSAAQAAQRVRVWASTWGIRQFQQIGGPSVTVWRELRRLGEDAEALQLPLFEGPRAAASEGNWFAFWMTQGGPEVARKDLTLKPFYVDAVGEKYGDDIKKIKGVLGTDNGLEYMEITRLTEWVIQRAGTAAANWQQIDFMSERRALAVLTLTPEFQRIGAAERTRTGINNCNPPTFDFSRFEQSDPADTAHLYIEKPIGWLHGIKTDYEVEPLEVYREAWAMDADLIAANAAYARHQHA